MQGLREEGFVIVLLGDFNGHLGPKTTENPHGVERDKASRNANGTVFLNFVERESLEIVNNMDVCKGTFTRVEGGSATVVDFGLIEADRTDLVTSMWIDEDHDFAQGSDHALLKIKLRISNTALKDWREQDVVRFSVNDRTDFTKFKEGVELHMKDLLEKIWEMSTTEKIERVQKALLDQAKVCLKQRSYIHKVKTKYRLPMGIKEKLKQLNRARNRVTRMELVVIENNDNRKVRRLQRFKNEVKILDDEVKQSMAKEQARKRARVRSLGLGPTTGARQFWKMVKLKNHPESIIWAFKTKAGKLEVELGQMMTEIQKEVQEKFCASHSPVFEDYQEQERKQAEEGRKMGIQKSALDWSDEVVPEFTTDEVEKLVKGLKDNRAPGYVGETLLWS